MPNHTSPTTLKDELIALHNELADCINKLGSAVECDEPLWVDYAYARWALTRASRKRWLLLEKWIFPLLQKAGVVDDAVDDLVGENEGWRDRSQAHLLRWPLNKPITDWEVFRPVSRLMRLDMARRIERERTAIYPLLDALKLTGVEQFKW